MPRKKVSPIVTTTAKLVIDFDNLPDESVSLADLKARRPWKTQEPKKKGTGRPNSHSQFNGPINSGLNRGRALAAILEHQHRKTFG